VKEIKLSRHLFFDKKIEYIFHGTIPVEHGEESTWVCGRDTAKPLNFAKNDNEEERTMKKFAWVLSCCTIALTASVASAGQGFYASGKVGVAMVNDLQATGNDAGVPWTITDTLDEGVAIGAGLGYDFGFVRAEMELSFQKNNYEKYTSSWGFIGSYTDGDLTSTALFANGYYDFKNASPFTPFVGAGIGYTMLEINDMTSDDGAVTNADDKVLAYQLMAGFSYAINRTLAFDFTYRFVNTTEPSFKDRYGTVDYEFTSHNFLMGARVNF